LAIFEGITVTHSNTLSRRAMLASSLGWPALLPAFLPAWARAADPAASSPGSSSKGQRILVVLELSGGNDGLNTVVPYADDVYHRLRPNLAIKPARVRKLNDQFGLNAGMAGFERLFKDGRMAIVHGCGYEQPSFSHFQSMAFWHTAAPNSGESTGWVGRVADTMRGAPAGPAIVNIDSAQSLAVASQTQVPVVFDDPKLFERKALHEQRGVIDQTFAGPARASASALGGASDNRAWLRDIAKSARDASSQVREANAKYTTPVDYGIVPVDLPKVSALIHANYPARLYYVAYRNNAFDTHVHQGDLHQRLLTYVADAVSGFMRDMERIGRAEDVVLLAFSEFGRRVPENANLGTDHGTAGPMFVVGKPVKGGLYGEPVSLSNLLPDSNLRHTTDFRRVYASCIDGWLGADSAAVLRGRFEPFPLFA
jgi:uncharacterized protein (DUF1501 family)